MRIAAVAPHEEFSEYEHAAARSNGQFELVHFVSDLASTAGIDELLARTDEFDAVTMLSPNSISHEQIDKLAAGQKHVLGSAHHTTPEFVDEMASKWQNANAHFAVAQPRRFTDYAASIQDGLTHGQLGGPGLLRIHHWLEPDRSEFAQSHKTLWQTTTEEIDLACGFFEDSPNTVFAQRVEIQKDSSQQTFGGIVVHLGFANGGMALIDVAFHRGKTFYTATLVGSQGAAYADDHYNTNLIFRGDTQGVCVADGRRTWLRAQIESFVESIHRGEPDKSVAAMQLATRVSQVAMQCCGANKSAKLVGDSYEIQ